MLLVEVVLQKLVLNRKERAVARVVQLSTTVTLSQEHPVRNGFSGSDFGKSSHRNNGPLEPTYLLSVTVVLNRKGGFTPIVFPREFLQHNPLD